MKLSADVRIPNVRIPDVSVGAAVTAIRDEFRRHAIQVDLISEGHIYGNYNARSSIPTGAGANGDEVKKVPRIVEGPVGAKFIITGWTCVASGDPATWEEMRVFTGN